jgi:hypothetical protein
MAKARSILCVSKVGPKSFFKSCLLLWVSLAMPAASGLELHAMALEQAANATHAAIANPTPLAQVPLHFP